VADPFAKKEELSNIEGTSTPEALVSDPPPGQDAYMQRTISAQALSLPVESGKTQTVRNFFSTI
jgi:hypothetical protein